MNAAYEAVTSLTLRGTLGQAREIDAVIDTGFNGFLTLPPPLVAELGLPFLSHGCATLADGSTIAFDVWKVTVQWDDGALSVEADEPDATPLVGMLLLDNHSYVEVADGGRVVLQAMG